MKKWLLLLILAAPCLLPAQITLDIGIFNQPAGSNQLEIRLIPNQTLTNAVYSAGVFTIRYPQSYGVSLVAPTNLNASLFNYNLANQGIAGGYQYYSFSFVSPYTINWTAGSAYTIALIHIVSGSSSGTGTFEIVNDAWTAAHNGDVYQELNGNVAQGIIYQPSATAPLIPLPPDTVPPSIACTGNKTVSTTSNTCAYTHSGTAWNAVGNDNYPGFTITYFFSGAGSGMTSSLDNSVFNLGTTTVTAIIRDGANLADTCTFTVTVADQQAPAITPPPALSIPANAAACSAVNVVLGSPVVSDNCGTPQVNNNAPAQFPVGNTVVTWTATDAAGLTATATQLVTVQTNMAATGMNLTNTQICLGGTSTLSFLISGGVSPYQIAYNINGAANSVSAYSSNQPIVVSPPLTAVYVLTQVTDAIGCTITPAGFSRTLFVKPKPVFGGLSLVSSPVCAGEPVSIIASGLIPDVPTIFHYSLNGIPGMQTVTSASDSTAELLGSAFSGGTYAFALNTITVAGCQAVFSAAVSFDVDTVSDNCRLSLDGIIATEVGHPVRDVALHLSEPGTSNSAFQYTTASDSAGQYTFTNSIPYGSNIQLTPYKNDNHLNGVTTFDLVLISKHILGLQTLDSPYKIIAADANHSGLVTTADIVELRKMILGITDELPSNPSWRFVPASFTFPDPQQPLANPFPEQLLLEHLTINRDSANFIAIKTGDVNGNVITSVQMPSIEERSAAPFMLDITGANGARECEPGEEISLHFRPVSGSIGFQLTLETTGLEVIDIIPENGMHSEHFGVLDGAVTVSYFDETEGRELPGFVIRFRVKTGGRLDGKLRISCRITLAEAYVQRDERISRQNIQVRFLQDGLLQHEVASVWPNPFSSFITIRTRLEQEDTILIVVADETGREMFTCQRLAAPGQSEILVDTSLFPAGVFTLKIQTSHTLAVKKILKL